MGIGGLQLPSKPIRWIGSSRKDLQEAPEHVRWVMGTALRFAQVGDKHPDAKPLKGYGYEMEKVELERLERQRQQLVEEPRRAHGQNSSLKAEGNNVFKDLGFPNPEEALLKADLVVLITRRIRSRGVSQTEAGAVLGIPQSKVSDLLRGKLRGFSVERLLGFLLKLSATTWKSSVRERHGER